MHQILRTRPAGCRRSSERRRQGASAAASVVLWTSRAHLGSPFCVACACCQRHAARALRSSSQMPSGMQFLATGFRLRDRWRLRHLPLVTPVPFLLGHLHNFRRRPIYLCCEMPRRPHNAKTGLSGVASPWLGWLVKASAPAAAPQTRTGRASMAASFSSSSARTRRWCCQVCGFSMCAGPHAKCADLWGRAGVPCTC